MKHTILRHLVVFALVFGLFSTSLMAQAMTPTLSVSATGSGDSVIISVYGDPYASVVLYYQSQGYNYGSQSQYIGTTNSSGYLSTTVSSTIYGITSNSIVYVVVNNQTSTSVVWPYNYNYNYGSLTLSQTSATISVGQSVDVTISGGNTPYTMSSGGTNVFQAVISGNRLHVAGLANGSGSVNICSSAGTGSGCAILYVTINPVNYYNPPVYNPLQPAITFSQNNPTLNVGQSMTISISGGNNYGYYYSGSGNYYIGYNSNSSGLSAAINGSTLTIQGLANDNTAVVVCSSSTNCSALNVTVGATNYNYTNPGNWSQCASEGQFCSFMGTQNVRYGANGVYVYRMIANGTTCSNAVFGDPIFGVVKQCSIGGY